MPVVIDIHSPIADGGPVEQFAGGIIDEVVANRIRDEIGNYGIRADVFTTDRTLAAGTFTPWPLILGILAIVGVTVAITIVVTE